MAGLNLVMSPIVVDSVWNLSLSADKGSCLSFGKCLIYSTHAYCFVTAYIDCPEPQT